MRYLTTAGAQETDRRNVPCCSDDESTNALGLPVEPRSTRGSNLTHPEPGGTRDPDHGFTQRHRLGSAVCRRDRPVPINAPIVGSRARSDSGVEGSPRGEGLCRPALLHCVGVACYREPRTRLPSVTEVGLPRWLLGAGPSRAKSRHASQTSACAPGTGSTFARAGR